MTSKWSENWKDTGLNKKEKEIAVQLSRFTMPSIKSEDSSKPKYPHLQAFNISNKPKSKKV